MKILILNGSPRINGITSQLLSAIAESLTGRHEIETVDIYNKIIAPCRGCEACRPDKRCILPDDDAHIIAHKIDKADMLIAGSPTYWGNMSAPMKTLFDRLVPVFEYIDGYKIRPKQKGKKAVIVTASSAPWPVNMLPSQSTGTVRSLKTVLKAGGYRIYDIVNVPHSAAFSKKKDRIISGIENKYGKL